MIPHLAPPVWPEIRPARFAQTILHSSPEVLDAPPGDEHPINKCSVALLGMPDDEGIDLNRGRPGAAQGPHAIRSALARYGVAAPADADAFAAPFPRVFDAGDVIRGSTIHQTHDRVSDAAEALTRRGLIPVGLGGGHDLTFALVRGVARALGPLDGVYLDAHLDVRAEVGSGMPFRALLDAGHATALAVVGLNPLANTREHFDWFQTHGGRSLAADVALRDPTLFEPPAGPLAGPMFVSLDLDVLDASAAPGVSAPNPSGLLPREVETLVRRAGRSPAVRCFDIMELSPPHDHEGRTARLAAHLLLTFLRGVAERRPAQGARA